MPDWLVSRFSVVGLIVVVMQQLPGIVWAIRPPKVDPFAQNSGTLMVEVLEKTFGIATVALLIIVVRSVPLLTRHATALVAGAFVVLAAYYGLYIAYYLGIVKLPVLLGMAAFPPLMFLLIALAQGNVAAVATSVLFGAVHIGLTYSNFRTMTAT